MPIQTITQKYWSQNSSDNPKYHQRPEQNRTSLIAHIKQSLKLENKVRGMSSLYKATHA